MATEQEELEVQSSIGDNGFATDFLKVNTPDQSDIPHHPAADPTAQTPNQAGQTDTE